MRLRLFLAAMALLVTTATVAPRAQPKPRALIVDTDAAADDLVAIAFLLARRDVLIEAICLDTGEAHQEGGAANVLRLLALAGRDDVPVFKGRIMPLAGGHDFPKQWRDDADRLPGVTLPPATRKPDARSAVAFLTNRLSDRAGPIDILALGGLTNLAEAFAGRKPVALRQLTIMGGAINVPGNLDVGLVTTNRTAEWNLYTDPLAAQRVFRSGVPIRLVPLDATNHVRIDRAFVEALSRRRQTPLSRFTAQVLAANRHYIDEGSYYAWDTLAAVSIVAPDAVRFRPARIDVSLERGEEGRTVATAASGATTQYGFDAAAARFRQVFLETLAP